jgi:hypothetical protein
MSFGEPADQVDIVHGEIDDDADIGHPRRKRPDAGDASIKNKSPEIACLMAATAGWRSTTDHQRPPHLRALTMSALSTVRAIGLTGMWMLRVMQAGAVVMQMGRRRDCDGVDTLFGWLSSSANAAMARWRVRGAPATDRRYRPASPRADRPARGHGCCPSRPRRPRRRASR